MGGCSGRSLCVCSPGFLLSALGCTLAEGQLEPVLAVPFGVLNPLLLRVDASRRQGGTQARNLRRKLLSGQGIQHRPTHTPFFLCEGFLTVSLWPNNTAGIV